MNEALHYLYFQLYAAFEMAKETLKAQGTNGLDYNAEFFETIGRIVIGMTAEDIENIPEDTEFLTVIEILSEYEDDMELSQVLGPEGAGGNVIG